MLSNGRSLLVEQYKIININESDTFCDEIIADGEQKIFENADVESENKEARSCKVSWINDKKYQKLLSHYVILSNKSYNYSLKEFEDLQYTLYKKGDYYDWHIDTHDKPYPNGTIRKLSFTLCLNDEFEGGDFSICTPHPISSFTNKETFKLKKGEMIVFPSHVWHKVDKITEGTRKSLVGWIVGNQWK
jgi:PKHD-type hydroxylase